MSGHKPDDLKQTAVVYISVLLVVGVVLAVLVAGPHLSRKSDDFYVLPYRSIPQAGESLRDMAERTDHVVIDTGDMDKYTAPRSCIAVHVNDGTCPDAVEPPQTLVGRICHPTQVFHTRFMDMTAPRHSDSYVARCLIDPNTVETFIVKRGCITVNTAGACEPPE